MWHETLTGGFLLASTRIAGYQCQQCLQDLAQDCQALQVSDVFNWKSCVCREICNKVNGSSLTLLKYGKLHVQVLSEKDEWSQGLMRSVLLSAPLGDSFPSALELEVPQQLNYILLSQWYGIIIHCPKQILWTEFTNEAPPTFVTPCHWLIS